MSEKPEMVELQFTDLTGALRSIDVSQERFDDAVKLGKVFDGSSIKMAELEKSDLLLKPAMGTYFKLPWNGRVGRVLCDIFYPAEKPADFGREKEHEMNPRRVLKMALDEASRLGYSFMTSAEMEYFVVNNGHPLDEVGYFSPAPQDRGAQLRRDIFKALAGVGVMGEYLHHEVARGQYEICLRYDEALRTADNIVTFKYVVKNMASLKDLTLTFMPKPFSGMNGSGMHIHLSLRDKKSGENLFYGKERISNTAKHFIGGVLAHAKSLAGIAAPTVNSYKRLIAGYEAPVYICWGHMNRSALIRVPSFNSPKSARFELRMPDPSCNPYLVYAAVLAAGLEGISRGIDPGEACASNVYENHKDFEVLPPTLDDALTQLERDALIRRALGEAVVEKYIALKRQEWRSYKAIHKKWDPQEITDWERSRYLESA